MTVIRNFSQKDIYSYLRILRKWSIIDVIQVVIISKIILILLFFFLSIESVKGNTTKFLRVALLYLIFGNCKLNQVYDNTYNYSINYVMYFKSAYQCKDLYRYSTVSVVLGKMLKLLCHYLPLEMPIARFWKWSLLSEYNDLYLKQNIYLPFLKFW